MRNIVIGFLAILMAVPMFVGVARADIPINERVSIDGNLRFRTFFDERDFDWTNTPPAYYSTMRLMIGFKIQATDDVLFRAKLKDSRYVGVPATGDVDATTVGSRSSSYLSLQEGYVFATDVFDWGVDFQIGRFEMAYGRDRLMGASAWGLEGPNMYDGFRVMYDEPGMKLDFFSAVIRDFSFGDTFPDYRLPSTFSSSGVYRYWEPPGYEKLKRYLFGFAGSFLDGRLQPILLVDWDSYDLGFDADADTLEKPSQKEQEFWVTPGVYGNYTFEDVGGGKITVEGDAAVQVGQVNDFGAFPSSYSLFSFMAAAEGRYHFDHEMKPTAGLGFDVTGVGEGADDPTDVFVFYQPYFTPHKFRGSMDYFANVGNGLIDTYITGSLMPMDWMKLKLDVHNFRFVTNRGYDPRPNNNTKKDVIRFRQLGQEVDLLVKVKVKKGFYIDGGFNFFIPTEDFAWNVNDAVSEFSNVSYRQSDPVSYIYLVFTTMF